jgi:XRE family transcriptional regulator, regulator of sulfur utilization
MRPALRIICAHTSSKASPLRLVYWMFSRRKRVPALASVLRSQSREIPASTPRRSGRAHGGAQRRISAAVYSFHVEWHFRDTNDTFVAMEDKVAARKSIRRSGVTGDAVGAAQLGRRVAENLRQRRKARAMSLDDLARASGVSRAALSQIETCKSNPTVGVLWKIAVGLGVPISDLIGAARSGAVVLRRDDSQLLRSADGKFESRPLAPAGASPLVELYELRLAARSTHASDAHAPGTHELLVVLSGQLRMHVHDEVYELAAGDSIAFAADRRHAYENTAGSEARYHNIIVYER